MTVPGVRVASARRTVIVAGALLTGQALLCAVIGFVTFDERADAPTSAQVVGPRFAAPPIVPHTPVPSATRSAAFKQQGVVRSHTSRPVPPPASTPDSPPRSSAPAEKETSPLAPEPSAAVSSAPPEIIELPPPPVPPAPSPTADPPVVGDPCDTEGATGSTAAGQAVRCERDAEGDLRWRLV